MRAIEKQREREREEPKIEARSGRGGRPFAVSTPLYGQHICLSTKAAAGVQELVASVATRALAASGKVRSSRILVMAGALPSWPASLGM